MSDPPPKRRRAERPASLAGKRTAGDGWFFLTPLLWVPDGMRPAQRRWLAGLLRRAVGPDIAPGLTLRLQNESRSAGPGAVLSLAVHAVVLLGLTWLVIDRSRAGDVSLDASWAAEDEPTEEGGRQIAVAPITIQSTVTETPDERLAPGRAMPQEQPEERSAAALRPADVDRLLADRTPERRQDALKELGGNEDAEKAIAEGLKWLVRRQKSAGNWQLHQPYSERDEQPGYPDAGLPNLRSDTAATALALLPLLGAGNSPTAGEHRDAVAKGVRWLVGVQKANGDLHDHDEFGRQTAYYAHCLGTIALCEAFALSQDESLRSPCERAVGFLIASQNPSLGGWKYQPLTDDNLGDLSVTGWGLMALHTARAAGIAVPEDAFRLAGRFLDSVQTDDGSRYKYMPEDPPGRASTALTAEGLLGRIYLGWPADRPELLRGVADLTSDPNRPVWQSGKRNVYGWYYAAQMLHQLGGPAWRDWYAAGRDAIVPRQSKSGGTATGKDIRGSWSPKPLGDPHEYADAGGRLYVTAMCLLILETPYRHRSVYEDAEDGKP